MKRLILCALVALVGSVMAFAAPSPTDILKKILSRHKGIKDYIATVEVDTDIPDVNIPHRKATVYVKPPDKIHVDASGAVIIPRRALMFGDIGKDIKDKAKVVLAGSKTEGGKTTYCLKIIPTEKADGPAGGEGRVLLWVNDKRWTVDRVHVYVGGNLVAKVEYTYKYIQKFWMPTKVACALPRGAMGSDKPGNVCITFSDYRINTGLTDEFFDKKAPTRSTRQPIRKRRRWRQ